MPVELHRNHPDVQQPWAEWSEDETLHVAAAYSNPFRWRTRRELANNFRRHMNSSPNIVLHMGELAYGDRPFEVTNPLKNPLDVQFRTGHELFHKENILARVISTFPPGWKYGAWIDADFTFSRHDFALETIHQLQMYAWVQMFSSYTDLTGQNYGHGHLPIRVTPGFAYNYIQNGYKLPDGFSNGGWRTSGVDLGYYGALKGGKRGVGATGGAWAFTKESYNLVGGLLEECILGHGDWFSTFGLVGEEAPDMHIDGYSDDYRNVILSWQKNAARIKKNIGYIDCFATHHFHGSKMKRGYASRDQILVAHKFSPSTDLKRDYQGIWQLNANDKPDLRDAVRAYFLSRNEDSTELHETEKPMV